MIIKEKSYGKVNLLLEVKGKMSNGLHSLDMIMKTINIYDVLQFEELEQDQIFIIGMDDINIEKNLIYKAASYLKNKFFIKKGIKISVKKNIPMGAGLGGGSSNAATTLKVLNKLWRINISNEELSKIAFTLGSDVPFFIYGNTCRVCGCGEQVYPIQFNVQEKAVLFILDFECPTGLVYKKYDDISDDIIHPQSVEQIIMNKELHNSSYLFNDLNKCANYFPNEDSNYIGDLQKEIINAGFTNTFVSGSGSSVIAFYNKDMEVCIDNLLIRIKHKFQFVTKYYKIL